MILLNLVLRIWVMAFQSLQINYIYSAHLTTSQPKMAPSKFIEILDNTTNPIAQQHQMSDSDVKLEDVLADQEATIQQHQRSRSSTQSSSSRKSHEYTNTSSNHNNNSNNPRLSMSRDAVVVDSQSSSSSASSSPSSSSTTSPAPKVKRLRRFTLTGGFGR
ncbi:hypothetical protein TMatcc_002752 [Talaromyces marneffei ATCC 18224]|nr:uncharacterized protein EYB26_002155 [Talaromyces marneffei]KAE8555501.1 hypothetical protein EYB25_000198 [Talaromyces marneffei]QGA14501.1 hypothetical protein EYB26_002155 [Talaromyces marneffei]